MRKCLNGKTTVGTGVKKLQIGGGIGRPNIKSIGTQNMFQYFAMQETLLAV